MVEACLKGIFAHWTQGLMAAFIEGFNRLFSSEKRNIHGCRTVGYMMGMFYFAAGLPLQC
jgi:hypothetical protein